MLKMPKIHNGKGLSDITKGVIKLYKTLSNKN